jgi:hypothetical protein
VARWAIGALVDADSGHGPAVSGPSLGAASAGVGVVSTPMSGDRPILGADVHAILRSLGPGAYEADLAEAWIDDDDLFTSVEALEAACPPERIGLSPGAFAALLGPLFGEFE